MRKTEQYKDHAISAETRQVGDRFGWAFQIDGGEIVESRGQGVRSEEAALSEAITNAKWSIDPR